MLTQEGRAGSGSEVGMGQEERRAGDASEDDGEREVHAAEDATDGQQKRWPTRGRWLRVALVRLMQMRRCDPRGWPV